MDTGAKLIDLAKAKFGELTEAKHKSLIEYVIIALILIAVVVALAGCQIEMSVEKSKQRYERLKEEYIYINEMRYRGSNPDYGHYIFEPY